MGIVSTSALILFRNRTLVLIIGPALLICLYITYIIYRIMWQSVISVAYATIKKICMIISQFRLMRALHRALDLVLHHVDQNIIITIIHSIKYYIILYQQIIYIHTKKQYDNKYNILPLSLSCYITFMALLSNNQYYISI